MAKSTRGKARRHSTSTYVISAVIIIFSLVMILRPIIPAVWEQIQGYALKVGSATVSQGEMRYFIANNGAMYEMYYGGQGGDVMAMDAGNGMTVGDMVVSASTDNLVELELAKVEAAKRGISLTEEEQAEVDQSAADFATNFDQATIDYVNLSDAELRAVLEKQKVAEKLRTTINDEFVLNEADYDAYIEDYYLNNRQTLDTFVGDVFMSTDKANADDFLAQVNGGGDFVALSEEMADPEPAAEIVTAEEMAAEAESGDRVLKSPSVPPAVMLVVADMEAGAVSEVIEVTGTDETQYYVVKLESSEQADMDQLREDRRETYITEQQNERYSEVMTALNSDPANAVTLNNTILSMLRMKAQAGKFPEAEAETAGPEFDGSQVTPAPSESGAAESAEPESTESEAAE